MAEPQNKKFERNLGKAADLRDARVRNVVELRKNAQDERLKKGRGHTEASSPLAAIQPMAAAGGGALVPAPARPQPSVHEIPSLFANIQMSDPAVVLEATRGFRRLLSLQKDPPITEVVETGVVPIFVSFLRHDHMPDLQFEASWALTNVASGTSTHTRAVTDAGAALKTTLENSTGAPNDPVNMIKMQKDLANYTLALSVQSAVIKSIEETAKSVTQKL
jgi:type III secretion apparatus needle protein